MEFAIGTGAAHQLRTSLYPAAGGICGITAAGLVGIAGEGGVTCNALAATGAAAFTSAGPALTGVANATATQNDWGFAVQGVVKVNMPWIAPGDTLYLQATYEHGAIGYITGNTLAYTGGFWASSSTGNGFAATAPGTDTTKRSSVIASGRFSISARSNRVALF